MSHLFPLTPVFLDLAGKPITLLSGAPQMAAIAARLLDAGAGVRVVDPTPSAPVRDLSPGLRLIERKWRAVDMKGAALVIASADEDRPLKARASARSARAFFYMVDAPEMSDGLLGDSTISGAITIGMATGATPEPLAHVVRKRLETAAPGELAGFFAAAARLAPKAAEKFSDQESARKFWAAALQAAIAERPNDWRAWLTVRLDRARRR
jgi:uroporphyrin-III C-methyltransferase/precorrin-2 dehydrogenase/sirohydrochlorin ferrochelatase